MYKVQELISITSDDLVAATNAAFPGLPAGMSMGEANRRVHAALDTYVRRLCARITTITEEVDKVNQS
jgi:hypothetical protein